MDHNYIDNYIQEGLSETFSLQNFYETKLVSNEKKDHIFRIPFYDFFLEHYKDFENELQFYHIPEHMYYKPKTVSFDIYGTTEMWLPILRVNKMSSIVEFHKPIIQIYNPNTIFDLISIFFKREGKS